MIDLIALFSHWLHAKFIWLLLGTYAVAAVAPGFGLWIKNFRFNDFILFGAKIHVPLPLHVSLPMLMLALLLLNAGLGVQTTELRHLMRRPWPLVTGLGTNLLIPLIYIVVISLVFRLWHDPDETQNILVGLALLASMPIAGSSTAWSQNADGDLTLSLGLVLFSTVLSPLTTPTFLHSVGLMTTGDYSEDLHELANSGSTGVFLTICVIVPSFLGIGLRGVLGAPRAERAKPTLKLINSLNLLLLNYSNASVSLPESVANPDPDFVSAIVITVCVLCALTFYAGWLVSGILRLSPTDRVSMVFGLGMNNNGTGLVLASLALADHPRVMLPIIFYTLVQNVFAGCVDRLIFRRVKPAEAAGQQPPHNTTSAM
ncbi:bile acid:sodium symporter family protein [Mycobacterium sp. ML4]